MCDTYIGKTDVVHPRKMIRSFHKLIKRMIVYYVNLILVFSHIFKQVLFQMIFNATIVKGRGTKDIREIIKIITFNFPIILLTVFSYV